MTKSKLSYSWPRRIKNFLLGLFDGNSATVDHADIKDDKEFIEKEVKKERKDATRKNL